MHNELAETPRLEPGMSPPRPLSSAVHSLFHLYIVIYRKE